MNVPIGLSDLESIVYNISRDLMEEQAINGLIDGITEETTSKIVDEVAFIINRYMYYINELMDTEKLSQIKND